tara:strand:+ start:163 stop:327 length:165 start_codon:yes stop_codon:yes gene_type:complete
MPILTNNSHLDAFADDDYQSKEFIENAKRERFQEPIVKLTYDDIVPLLNQIFKQ